MVLQLRAPSKKMVLLIDNYDSFTYMLHDYILQCGETCLVIRNDEKSLSEISELSFSSIVISAGPKTPDNAGITLPLIEKLHTIVPILGICLGHQALGSFFGMKLKRAAAPTHGKTSLITTNSEHFLFKNLPETFEVMRYHSLILEAEKTSPMETIAQTQQNEIMAIAHPKFPLAGLQFHPESILTVHGLQILKNWFGHIKR